MVQSARISICTEPPWALLTSDGVRFIDPDNEAVAVYERRGLIGLPSCRKPPHLAQAELFGLLRRSSAVVADATARRARDAQ